MSCWPNSDMAPAHSFVHFNDIFAGCIHGFLEACKVSASSSLVWASGLLLQMSFFCYFDKNEYIMKFITLIVTQDIYEVETWYWLFCEMNNMAYNVNCVPCYLKEIFEPGFCT